MPKMKRKYPCGYEIEVSEFNATLYSLEEEHCPIICPLHGKNCKPNKSKLKKRR